MAVILVIDDERGIRRMVRRTLARMGHTVREAPDGRIGLEIMRGDRVDLVVTDILMPAMEGIETIREIRRAFSATGIIAMSGGGTAERNMMYLDAAAKLGADATLRKPFRAHELAAAVERVLRLSRPPRD